MKQVQSPLPFLAILLCGFVLLTTSCNGQTKPQPTSTNIPMHSNNPYYSHTNTSKLNVPDSEWKKILSEEVYHVAREKGTERAFTGKYTDYKGLGKYYCAVCGNPLFRSDEKFSSTCGWPSFFETLSKQSVIYLDDNSYGMVRTEVQCARCNSHLGHLFDDGPPPTGKRFCMNSIVLEFEAEKK